MSDIDIVEACRTLLDGYEGTHRDVLEKLWKFYEDSGELEDNLLKGFDHEDVELTPREFIAVARQLEGEQVETFYTELDTNKEFADSIVAEMSLLPDIGKPLTRGDESEGDENLENESSEESQTQGPTVTREELAAKMANPEYRTNLEFREAVSQGFRDLYGEDSAPGSNPSSGHTLHGVREESSQEAID